MPFNHRYFIAFVILLITEILIASFVTQPFIRFIFGDFLVVILIYCFVKSFLKIKPIYAALAVLAFAFAIEFLQASNLLETLKLEDNKWANLIMGNTFGVGDLVAYTFGIVAILLVEKYLLKPKKARST